MPLLELDNCTIHFEGVTAVSGLDLAVQPGELIALIGPNGAGKTTVFNMISGIYRPDAGDLRFAGRSIAGLPPHQVARAGIARTFQNIRLFQDLSVLDNVRVAAYPAAPYPMSRALLRTAAFAKAENKLTAHAMRILRRLGLYDLRKLPARSLPYGQQRRLEIARALATHPRLLMLDEPTAGMNPRETDALMHLIRRVRDEFDLTVLLIEHDMRVVMGICERVVVLDYGVVIAQGPPDVIRKDPGVIEAYLGEAPA
ncbi:MAG: ABC transporter ATP-binding protein [Armatimonadota bacterium]|nr:MAG: ABC transporter ATP-binding protein [Armatimonadota bacterium]